MGKPRRYAALIVAATLCLAAGVAAAGGGSRVETLPITGLMRVSMADGSVVYMSTDRRFVFRGEMTDLWTGVDAAIELPSGRVDLDRNGVDLERISLRVGRGARPMTVFVSPECEQCRAVLSMMLEPKALKEYTFRVVLLDSTPRGANSNAVVWCAKDPVEALRSVYLEGRQPASAAKAGTPCDQFGLEQGRAAARLFGIAQLPLLVGADGMGHVGVPATLASVGTGERR
jgi:hypothetical protein